MEIMLNQEEKEIVQKQCSKCKLWTEYGCTFKQFDGGVEPNSAWKNVNSHPYNVYCHFQNGASKQPHHPYHPYHPYRSPPRERIGPNPFTQPDLSEPRQLRPADAIDFALSVERSRCSKWPDERPFDPTHDQRKR